MPPLSSVLSVTMTQVDSTLASLPQWAWHPSHTPAYQSVLCPHPLLTDDMLPLWMLQLLQELVFLLDPDLATFLTVFGPLVQHCPVANLLVSSDHWLSVPGWRGGGGQPLLPGWASSAPSSLRRTRPWRTSSSRGRQ